MTREEAKAIASIMLEADGGCYLCAAYLCEDFAKTFPPFREVIEDVYSQRYDSKPIESIENP